MLRAEEISIPEPLSAHRQDLASSCTAPSESTICTGAEAWPCGYIDAILCINRSIRYYCSIGVGDIWTTEQ